MSLRAISLRCAVSIVLLCCHAALARAQGTAIVPAADRAYADIDRLGELGALDSAIVGQRPYSRREIARIVRVVQARREGAAPSTRDGRLDAVDAIVEARREGASTSARDGPRDEVNAIVRRLAARFAADGGDWTGGAAARLVEGASLTASSTDAQRRGLRGTYSDALEATIDPLALRRLGLPAARGQSLAVELSHTFEPARWLSLHLTERLEGIAARDASTSRHRAELLLGGVRARFRNVALRVGREQVTWAQAPGDGLFLASDAPALDLVSLGGDETFALPGPLRRLGAAQATLIVAELGPSVVRSHSKLLAYKVSVQPRRSIELGATFMNHYGGEGGRATGFGNRLVDFLPFIDIFRGHNYTDTTRTFDVDSDKLLGVDGRVRFERLGGMVVSGELLIDDFAVDRVRTLLTWDGAQTMRMALPGVAGSAFTLEVSAKHTGVRTYTHGVLSNGITTRGRLLGDEIGPDAKAFGGALRWQPAGAMHIELATRSAIYSRADYVIDGDGARFRIRRIGPASNELRDRGVATLVMDRGAWVSLTARVAGERIRNDAFTGRTRRAYAADVALRFAR